MPFGMSVPQSMIVSRTVAKGSLVAKATVATLLVVPQGVRFRRQQCRVRLVVPCSYCRAAVQSHAPNIAL